jgi:hypothetical protein
MTATTVQTEEPSEPSRTAEIGRRSLPGDRARTPLVVFVVLLALAVPTFLWIGRDQWFFLDEWDFLATRDGGSIAGLLEPHNEHWTTVPIVIFRVLYNIFGLHTYLPYQLVPLIAHVVTAGLLFLVMRRVDVNPWIAVAAASLFAFFGSGSQNVVWAFQITFVGGLMFGLAQLCLADHDGPMDWRDLAAIGAGLLALMCSGVGLTMLAAVGVAIFVRRGWRMAALQTVPLAIVYGLWFRVYTEGGNPQNSSTASQVLDFVVEGLKATYTEMGQLPGVGLVLALTLLVGAGLVLKGHGLREGIVRYAVPLVLIGASVAFIFTAATTRADMLGTGFARASRYLYVIAALSLPAIAVAADAIARRWPLMFPFGIVLFLLPIPWSIDGARTQNPNLLGDPTVVAVVDAPEFAGVDPDTVLVARSGRAALTLGWLQQAAAEGKIPEMDPDARAKALVNWKLRLALVQKPDPATDNCEPIDRATRISLTKGESFSIKSGPVKVFTQEQGGSPYNFLTFHPEFGPTFEVMIPQADLVVAAADPRRPASLCR